MVFSLGKLMEEPQILLGPGGNSNYVTITYKKESLSPLLPPQKTSITMTKHRREATLKQQRFMPALDFRRFCSCPLGSIALNCGKLENCGRPWCSKLLTSGVWAALALGPGVHSTHLPLQFAREIRGDVVLYQAQALRTGYVYSVFLACT